MHQTPVILLTFANHQDAYLPMITAEQKAIKQALLDYADQNYLQVRDVQRTSTEEVFYLVNRYHNRICILHYAGHAEGEALQLEQEIGVVQMAGAKGIAGLLGTQQNLRLVFLNGCSTRAQVKTLLDQGVPAVIATSVAIQDSSAQQFAEQFYQALGSGSTLGDAFTKARAFLESQGNGPPLLPLEQSRNLAFAETADQMPWGLYWKAEQERVLQWKLPRESSFQLDFRTDTAGQRPREHVNSLLVDSTLKAIRHSAFVKDLARKITQQRQTGDPYRKPTDAEKKDAIIRSFPAPISVHLRSLFSGRLGDTYDKKRLQQLLLTYQISVKLAAFILLSDIWDDLHRQTRQLTLDEGHRRQLRAFFDLNAFTAKTFDYFLLGDALLQIASQNQIEFYLEPLQKFRQGWLAHPELAAVHAHFQSVPALLETELSEALLAKYCAASEEQLSNLLSQWHFLVQYKMAVVKNIEVYQVKNLPPTTYRHVMVELDNNSNDIGRKDRQQALATPTDIESVLMYEDQLGDHLNLSPFVLDENALIREFNSKVYFFSHLSEDALHYYWIENERDQLEITDHNYAYIRQQFAHARQVFLAEAKGTRSGLSSGDEDDILSLL